MNSLRKAIVALSVIALVPATMQAGVKDTLTAKYNAAKTAIKAHPYRTVGAAVALVAGGVGAKMYGKTVATKTTAGLKAISTKTFAGYITGYSRRTKGIAFASVAVALAGIAYGIYRKRTAARPVAPATTPEVETTTQVTA